MRVKPSKLVEVIDAASAGDHVLVDSGEFVGQITITKPITIQGVGRGTWLGNRGPVIIIEASGVRLHDLEIEVLAGGGDDAIVVRANFPPELVNVRIARGNIATVGLSFADPPSIRLGDVTRERATSSGAAPSPVPPPIPGAEHDVSRAPRSRSAPPPLPVPALEAGDKPRGAAGRSHRAPSTRPRALAPPPPVRAPVKAGWSGRVLFVSLWLFLAVAGVLLLVRSSKLPTQTSADECRAGDADACRQAVEEFPHRRGELAKLACSREDWKLCVIAGQLSSDPDEALLLFARACERLELEGCLQWAVAVESRAPAASAQKLRELCDVGYRDSCARLAARGGGTAPEPPRNESCPKEQLREVLEYVNRRKGPVKPVDPEYWARALQVATATTRALPSCAAAWSALSYVSYRFNYKPCFLGDMREAHEAVHRALALPAGSDAERAAALRNLGRILASRAKSDWPDAIRAFHEAAELDPGNTDTRSWLESFAAATQPVEEIFKADEQFHAVVVGAPLREQDVAELSVEQLVFIREATSARHGVQLNQAPSDWLVYCDGTALWPSGSPFAVDREATRSRFGTVDVQNLELIESMLDRKRGG